VGTEGFATTRVRDKESPPLSYARPCASPIKSRTVSVEFFSFCIFCSVFSIRLLVLVFFYTVFLYGVLKYIRRS